MMTRPMRLIAGLLIGAAALAEPADPAPTGGRALERNVTEAFAAGEYPRALGLLRAALVTNPQDPVIAYNLACALAMTGAEDEAAEMLIDAVSFGFSNFFHAERDPHLDPLRGNGKYAALMRGWKRVLDVRGERELDAAKEALGPTYTYSRDEALRLTFASAMHPDSFLAARREIERTARWAEQVLGMTGSPDESKPDAWVMVILPTPGDFVQLIGVGGVGGYYDKDRRRLVAQDIGATLRHEFLHVLHWRHMERLGQQHPYWVMEGLAALLEDIEDDGEGYRIAPSWRTNIVRRLERLGRLTPWDRLFAMERDAFMKSRARGNYAESRAVLMFLHDRGRLGDWYRNYIGSFEEDPSGMLALERALGVNAGEAWRGYREWIRGLPMVAEAGHPSEAGFGVEFGPGAGDGPVVTGLGPLGGRRKAGTERLRLRDVVISIDGRAVRSMDDLYRILGEKEVGDVVMVGIRRGTKSVEVPVELVSSRDRLP